MGLQLSEETKSRNMQEDERNPEHSTAQTLQEQS